MNIHDHFPISAHNAKAWDLKELDMSMTLRCPDQNGVLTLCDYSETQTKLASLSLAPLTENRGFDAQRTDSIPIQAQYVRPGETYDAQGKNVFDEPIESLPVRYDFVTDLWRIDIDSDNVNDAAGLNVLVWALAHHGLKKKKNLLASVHN